MIYGALIGDGTQPMKLFLGYLLGAAVMIAGGLCVRVLGPGLTANSRLGLSPSADSAVDSPVRRCGRPVLFFAFLVVAWLAVTVRTAAGTWSGQLLRA